MSLSGRKLAVLELSSPELICTLISTGYEHTELSGKDAE